MRGRGTGRTWYKEEEKERQFSFIALKFLISIPMTEPLSTSAFPFHRLYQGIMLRQVAFWTLELRIAFPARCVFLFESLNGYLRSILKTIPALHTQQELPHKEVYNGAYPTQSPHPRPSIAASQARSFGLGLPGPPSPRARNAPQGATSNFSYR